MLSNLLICYLSPQAVIHRVEHTLVYIRQGAVQEGSKTEICSWRAYSAEEVGTKI